MHASTQLHGENRIDHTMPFDSALSTEGLGYDMNSEMRLATRPGAGMPLVLSGFVHHFHSQRRESLGQLFGDEIADAHAGRLSMSCFGVNDQRAARTQGCQVLNVPLCSAY
jgi:hypothetical protein